MRFFSPKITFAVKTSDESIDEAGEKGSSHSPVERRRTWEGTEERRNGRSREDPDGRQALEQGGR